MDRRSTGNLHIVSEAELELCRRMVEHFDRKGLHETFWHDDLKRLESSRQELLEKEIEEDA